MRRSWSQRQAFTHRARQRTQAKLNALINRAFPRWIRRDKGPVPRGEHSSLDGISWQGRVLPASQAEKLISARRGDGKARRRVRQMLRAELLSTLEC